MSAWSLLIGRANSRSPSSSRTSAKCSSLPTSTPTHTVTCSGVATCSSFSFSRVAAGGRSVWCARRHPPYESAIERMSPSEVHAPARAGGNTPQAINRCRGQ